MKTWSGRAVHKWQTMPSKKVRSRKQILGIDQRALVNKDSPDYKPNYGKVFTERQQKILNEEISLDDVRLQELSIIKKKAEALGDEEKAEIASFLIGLKTAPEEFEYTVKKEDAKAVLQSLTPWEINWKE